MTFMTSRLGQLLAASAILDIGTSHTPDRYMNSNILENGNSRRSHKQNVRRKRLRRLSKKSKQINRS